MNQIIFLEIYKSDESLKLYIKNFYKKMHYNYTRL